MNERIRAKEIRVIDEEGKQLGVMPPFEALKVAREKGLDLVEVSPTANPPVCRIINYGKFLYQQSKREHEARKHQKSMELKEVKFRPRTGEHDFEVKRNKMVGFLKEGDKVKATIMFRGRENAHRDIGYQMMERLIESLAEAGQVESRPKQEGPNLSAVFAPKKVSSKGGGQPKAAAPQKAAGGRSAAPPAQPKADPQPISAVNAAAPTGTSETSGG
ncbi:MAG TPA: translation initiation factor IF-3 [Terriglobia bacterium]|nr:translation initiation factor IF-3 [Terriglobia bacterium]